MRGWGYLQFNKTRSPISVSLCILCFQRHPFRFLFYFTAIGIKYSVVAEKRPQVFHIV